MAIENTMGLKSKSLVPSTPYVEVVRPPLVETKGGDGTDFFDASVTSFDNSYRDGGVM